MSDDQDAKRAQIPTGRFARLTKLGGTATAATARHALQKLRDVVSTDEERTEGRRQTLQKTAEQMASTLAEMKGAAMKVGQLLSLDPQVLPPEIRDALKVLQKSAPPMPFDVVEGVIARAFGKPHTEVFKEIDRVPLGAASIGQVHRAVAHDGQVLAVKVQYPGIADTIDSDVANLGAVLQMARMALPGIKVDDYLEELRLVLHKEADYTQEADTLERYAQVLAAFPYARVPKVRKDLTRRDVLSMELIEGEKFDDHLSRAPAAERDALATKFLDMFMRLFHEMYALHADPHPGNFLFDAQGKIVLLDFGCVKEFEPVFVDTLTEVLRAHWRGDAEALPAIYKKAGFAMPDGKVPDPDELYEWQEIVLEPFLRDEEFDFQAWRLEDKARAYLKDNMKLLNMHPPRQAMFYFRVCAGMRGMLTRTGARVNVHKLARELDKRLKVLAKEREPVDAEW